MPYQIEQLLEGKSNVVSVSKEDTILHALALMLEHDYSQLPVFEDNGEYYDVAGMVTYEGIIRGIRNFNTNIESLKARDVMEKAFTCNGGDDLFDILDRLKESSAAIVYESEIPGIAGIVTSYDITEYFRTQTEDLMRVEDIESTVKDLIKEAYTTIKPDGEEDLIDENRLNNAAKSVSYSRPKNFDKLSLSEYINLLTLPETWTFFEPIFNLSPELIKNLLNGVRETRNQLAHFRGDLSTEERDRLRFAVDWITRCQEDYQKKKEYIKNELFKEKYLFGKSEGSVDIPKAESVVEDIVTTRETIDYVFTESTKSGGRYAPLTDWLQSQPGRINQVPLTFNQIEEIIGADLPDSARVFRGWWANDSVGHTHSQLWLDAGWRTSYINLSEGRVTFNRIKEREKAYIDFFGELQKDLRRYVNFPIKDASPDGANWIVIAKAPRTGQTFASYVISFSRTKKLRVELYLDLLDKEKTKQVFESLLEKKSELISQVGTLEFERLENRRASRIALYKDGQITDENILSELRRWAVETIYKLYNATINLVEKEITEANKDSNKD